MVTTWENFSNSLISIQESAKMRAYPKHRYIDELGLYDEKQQLKDMRGDARGRGKGK